MTAAALVAVELAAGAANVLLLAPVWLQLVHLRVADLQPEVNKRDLGGHDIATRPSSMPT